MLLRSITYGIASVLLLAIPSARGDDDDTPPASVPKSAKTGEVADDPAAIEAFKKIGFSANCYRDKNGNVFFIHWNTAPPGQSASSEGLRLDCLKNLKGFPKLRKIEIWGGNPNGDIDYISELAQLETLEVTNSKLNDGGLALVAGLKGLKHLSLSGNRYLTDAALEYVARLGALEDLDLSSTKISGRGLQFLKRLKNLKRLDLSGTNITDGRLTDLARIGSLEDLDLSCPALALESIRELSRLTRLRKLDLYGTSITDSRLADLAAIVSLEELDLGHTKVTSQSLHELSRLSRLKELNLGGTERTRRGAEDLKKELPNLKIFMPSENKGGANTKQRDEPPRAGRKQSNTGQ